MREYSGYGKEYVQAVVNANKIRLQRPVFDR